MSQRDASSVVQAEVAKSANHPVHLYELDLDTPFRVTDAYRDIEWGGNTYTAAGHFLDFSGVEETADLSVTQVSVTLSGVDQSAIALVLQNDYIDRRMVIRTAFLDASAVLVDPVPIFDGRCDSPVIAEDPDAGTCSVTLSAAAHWIDFERKAGRHTNHDEQQIHFPGDRGFEFVSELNKEIKWGAA